MFDVRCSTFDVRELNVARWTLKVPRAFALRPLVFGVDFPSDSPILSRMTHCFFRPAALATLALVCLPPAPAASAADSAADWIPLFDGRSLEGWQASENPGSFKVVDGQIACDGPRAHLFYRGPVGGADFKNFECSAEVLTRPGANSGIYFHTSFQEKGFPARGFEVQVCNSYEGTGGYRELKKTGSLYGIRNQYKTIAPDDRWFTLRFAVRGKRVQIWVDDVMTVDWVEPEPPITEPGRDRRLSRGTIALQCHDPGSKVFYRNLKVKPLPDDVTGGGETPVVDDLYRQLLDLNRKNFPIVDFHGHLKGGLTLEELLAHSRRTGIFYGIAPNCGVGFSITNDAGIAAFLDSVRGQPVFFGMQAEGREWVKLFSPAAVARFDYVFTDSMTFTDRRGKRTRLWIKDEVEVGEPQAFMDMLVETTVGILEREPVDIYVNPTFLPDVIAKEYDTLWTEARMRRVISAAVRNGVAIEINSRFRLPSPAFIKLAKSMGAKFSLGTNNAERDLGRLEYSFRMIRECGLTDKDMFVPKPDGKKPVQVKGMPR